MNLPDTPKKWAVHLSNLLNQYHSIHREIECFPINVTKLAQEYSQKVFPSEPITLIKGENFSTRFEGALLPHPHNNGEWGILYNSSIQSKGRINFTLAHEFGHYLLHRKIAPQGKKCSRYDMLEWQSTESQIEVEANVFASNLLMPAKDFAKQIYNKEISSALIMNLVNRYDVSISAAALRWIDLCNERAMLIFAKDGFIDWARSSKNLIKSGIYYPAKQQTIELPVLSLATDANNIENEKIHEENVWIGNEIVKEILLYKKNEYSLSLLMYPANSTSYDEIEDDIEEMDGNLKFIK